MIMICCRAGVRFGWTKVPLGSFLVGFGSFLVPFPKLFGPVSDRIPARPRAPTGRGDGGQTCDPYFKIGCLNNANFASNY